ncbi:MAG: hypothetical protein IPJ04_08135 [Candidatus Eisenbacteria bacterium]|nr:hypothetical protein [Candidatus Eisenbacteria bacterium]
MKRLLFFALFAYVAWYGWNHRDGLRSGPHSEAVIENATSRPVTRIRLRSGGETVVREELAPGASTTIPIAPVANGEFHLVWQWGDAPGEPQWNGHFDGSGATARYRFRIEDAGIVSSSSEPIPLPAK